MDKFSNVRKKSIKNKELVADTLFENDYIKVASFEDWSIIQGKDCVVVIPYLVEENKFVLRNEYVPSYKLDSGDSYHLVMVGGCVEDNETHEEAMRRELEEEAGIILNKEFVPIELDFVYMNKGTTMKFIPYICLLTNNDYSQIKAVGDGSEVEKKSKAVKIDMKNIDSIKVNDLITDYMLMKLKNNLK